LGIIRVNHWQGVDAWEFWGAVPEAHGDDGGPQGVAEAGVGSGCPQVFVMIRVLSHDTEKVS
jgi:hypothetical protein